MNKDTIQVILMPKGYERASKEVREYIHLLEQDNVKLKEYYFRNVSKYEELIEKYSNLQEENKKLKKKDKTRNAVKEFVTNEYKSRINKAIEYMIKQRDVITDYVHQAKEINEDYLFLDRTSLETFKNIYEILKGEDND